MDEEILKRLCEVGHNEGEQSNLLLEDHDITEGVKEATRNVLIHIHGRRSIHFEGFKSAMGKARKCGSFSIQKRSDMFYQIYFGVPETVDYVLHNGPWNFENTLVLVRPIFDLYSENSSLNSEFFWILLTGLPRYVYTVEVGMKLMKILNHCQSMQLREDKINGTKYFRFRVLVDITKPLNRILRATTPDGYNHAGLLKYERLETLSFYCGHIGHMFRACSKMEDRDMEVKNMSFGPWMGGVDYIASELLFSYNSDDETTENDNTDNVIEIALVAIPPNVVKPQLTQLPGEFVVHESS